MAPDEQVAQLGHPGAHLTGAEPSWFSARMSSRALRTNAGASVIASRIAPRSAAPVAGRCVGQQGSWRSRRGRDRTGGSARPRRAAARGRCSPGRLLRRHGCSPARTACSTRRWSPPAGRPPRAAGPTPVGGCRRREARPAPARSWPVSRSGTRGSRSGALKTACATSLSATPTVIASRSAVARNASERSLTITGSSRTTSRSTPVARPPSTLAPGISTCCPRHDLYRPCLTRSRR